MSPRWLWPREHGAYAQLGVPLVAALAMRPPTLAAGLLAVGAILAFVAHEPLLVVLGHRGRRLRDEAGALAKRWLIGLGAIAIVAGGAGLALAPATALAATGLLAAPLAVLLVLAWRRREHTFAGELVAAVVLTGAAAPVACASGASLSAALTFCAVWAIGFATSVVAVHRVLARHRRSASAIDHVAALGLGVVTAASILGAAALAPILLVPSPLAAVATAVVITPPPATRLRTIGVVLVVAALSAAVIVVALHRA